MSVSGTPSINTRTVPLTAPAAAPVSVAVSSDELLQPARTTATAALIAANLATLFSFLIFTPSYLLRMD